MALFPLLNTVTVLFFLCFLLPVPCSSQISSQSRPARQRLPQEKLNQTVYAQSDVHHLNENSLSRSSKRIPEHHPQAARHEKDRHLQMEGYKENANAKKNDTGSTKGQEQGKQGKLQRIAKIAKLLQRSRDLHRRLLHERERNEEATVRFQSSLKRLSDLSAARAKTQKALRVIEQNLKEYRRQAPLYARTIEILHRQAGAAILEINRLRTSKHTVMHEKALLQDHFRHRGLEAWVQNYLKDSVNPLVAGAVVEGTADVVQPMLDGIETLAAMNEDIARKMANQIRESVPIVEKPFYSGFVTYSVLLFPLVLVTSVLVKIKRSLTKFSAGHFIILGNFYFTLLSGGCFIATLLGSVDVLLTFRHVNLGMFDLVMVLHGVLYIVHISIHVLMALRTREKALVIHTLLLVLVGSHFFIHSYLHAMHNEDPHVDKRAYAVYTGLFAYILYDWTVKHIQTSVETTRVKLNNKSISTTENQALAVVAGGPSTTGPRPSFCQHNSVPSSVSYALLNNDISRIEPASNGDVRIDNIFFSAPAVSRERGSSTELAYVALSSLRAAVGAKADDPKNL